MKTIKERFNELSNPNRPILLDRLFELKNTKKFNVENSYVSFANSPKGDRIMFVSSPNSLFVVSENEVWYNTTNHKDKSVVKGSWKDIKKWFLNY